VKSCTFIKETGTSCIRLLGYFYVSLTSCSFPCLQFHPPPTFPPQTVQATPRFTPLPFFFLEFFPPPPFKLPESISHHFLMRASPPKVCWSIPSPSFLPDSSLFPKLISLADSAPSTAVGHLAPTPYPFPAFFSLLDGTFLKGSQRVGRPQGPFSLRVFCYLTPQDHFLPALLA